MFWGALNLSLGIANFLIFMKCKGSYSWVNLFAGVLGVTAGICLLF